MLLPRMAYRRECVFEASILKLQERDGLGSESLSTLVHIGCRRVSTDCERRDKEK
jgi:hypothetical protein